MIRSLKFFLLLSLFLILTTFNSNKEKNYKIIFFKIKNINIENTKVVELVELKRDLEFLKGTSLLFLDEVKIIDVIKKYEFIANMRLRKSYPNTVEIKIFEKKPIAVQVLGNHKFYITEEGEKLIFFNNVFYEDLPLIFGNQKNFSSFFREIKQINFASSQIKAFYYFDIGRWDIVLSNDKIIKLPEKDYMKILMNINSILNDKNFSKYRILDYRIKDQLILE